jgi:hypothetical protein
MNFGKPQQYFASINRLPKVQVIPESLVTAAHDLAALGSNLQIAHLQAAAPTTTIASAGGDEVSAAISGLFGSHAQDFQKLAGQAAAFHDRFTQTLTESANAYASAESANATALASALPAEDNPWVTLVQIGALLLVGPIFLGLLAAAAAVLATYWALVLFGQVLAAAA